MSVRVGEVIAVHGVKITLKIDDDSSKETIYFGGEKFKGVSIREYITVQRGFKNIVCLVEGEYLDETRTVMEGGKATYLRKVECRPIGYFDGGEFKEGIKFMPMIRDAAFLLQEDRVAAIFGGSTGSPASGGFVIGRTVKEEIPVSLPWHKLFNTHIGIFGNTGSGKSNTLAKLYTVLFEQKAAEAKKRSRFVILDFNGEYTGAQLINQTEKTVLSLSTSGVGAKFPLRAREFWDSQTLSILFQATQNTQRPFLNRLIAARDKYKANENSIRDYVIATFEAAFTAAAPKAESLDLLREVASLLGEAKLLKRLKDISWYSKGSKFVLGNTYFDPDGGGYGLALEPLVQQIGPIGLDHLDELRLRANLRLTWDIVHGYVQFEHIQPLLKRIDAALSDLRKVIVVEEKPLQAKLLTVISLRKCKSEVKKILPLLIAKHYYVEHRESVGTPPDKTVHLIVDEAHNILSQSAARESESWKDYRLDLFEEIVKEGRKFGFFLTVSSQRPADISPTIVSQLHNFFIHRLVNDRDLFLIDNTITTLDSLSRGLIPNLSKGSCVVTGTSFDVPMLIQVEILEKSKQPDSEDVDLAQLWGDG